MKPDAPEGVRGEFRPGGGGQEWVDAEVLRRGRRRGGPPRLSALKGTPVVLNFWATWCKPCLAEMPRLEQAARDNAGIAFYEIDLDEDGAKVRGFFDSLEITHLVPLIDVGSTVARAYGLGQGVPTTFFIDANGIVRAASLGEMDTLTIATNLSTVKR